MTKFIQKRIEFKQDTPLPEIIHSQLKIIRDTDKQLCNKIISYEIIYKTIPVDEDVIYDFQPHDLSPQFNFIQMWCENRKTQPIPKFLEPLITNYTKF